MGVQGERQLAASLRKYLFSLSWPNARAAERIVTPPPPSAQRGVGDTHADRVGSPTLWLHALEGLRKFVAKGRRRHSRLQPPRVRVVRVRVLQKVAAVPAVVGAPVAVASR